MAKGLDVGTCFLVAAHQDPSGNTDGEVKSIRDAFLDIPNDDMGVRNMLKMSKVNFVEDQDNLYILGDSALKMANLLKREVRRPLSRGILAAGEKDAERILYMLIKEILGNPQHEGELVYYSIPAAPVDSDGDVLYHEAMFKKVVETFGYKAQAMNEAAAIVYSECQDTMFSALSTSFGAGLSNVALVYQTMIGMKFAVGMGGDFIDAQSAKAVGKTAAQMMAIKERGINLMDPNDGDPKFLGEREAIIVYYRNLIRRVVETIKVEFKKTSGAVDIQEEIPWVIAGGTSLPKGFLELFREEFSKVKDFPIKISEIRLASDQLHAVAKGLLIAAINSES